MGSDICRVSKQEIIPDRLNKEMRENSEKFDWSGIEFPVAALSTTQVDRFERQNPYGINILALVMRMAGQP